MKDAKITWCENVLLVDADYLDRTAFDLIVNFERMINRPLPPADLCRWVDCVALDSGMQPGEQATQVIFLHAKDKTALEHFRPSLFGTELDGVAFRDNLGEFVFQSFPVEEIVKGDTFFLQSLEMLTVASEVKRIMVVADMDSYGDAVRNIAAKAEDKDITLFAMQPLAGRGFSQEILGYSLMSALGIRGDELN